MVTYAHVLVATDGSPLAALAVPVAKAAAAWFGASLGLVSVAPTSAELERHQAHAADVAPLLGISPDASWTVLAPSAARGIASVADDLGRALVCLASHGHGRSAALLGSVAQDVVAELAAPVLVVGPVAAPGPEVAPVVLAVDGAAVSTELLTLAAEWADALNAELQIVTVIEPVPEPAGAHGAPRRHHGPAGDPVAYLEALAERVAALAGAGTPVVSTHVVADPLGAGSGLKAWLAAAPAKLVIASTHRRSGLARLVVGSGAAGIVHASPVPVLLVPAPR